MIIGGFLSIYLFIYCSHFTQNLIVRCNLRFPPIKKETCGFAPCQPEECFSVVLLINVHDSRMRNWLELLGNNEYILPFYSITPRFPLPFCDFPFIVDPPPQKPCFRHQGCDFDVATLQLTARDYPSRMIASYIRTCLVIKS